MPNPAKVRHLKLVVPIGTLCLIALFSLFGSILASTLDFDMGMSWEPPSCIHPFGTINAGQDLFTVASSAFRTTLAGMLLSSFIAVFLGLTLGMMEAMGDRLLKGASTLIGSMLSVYPPIFVGLLIIGFDRNYSDVTIMAVFGLMVSTRVAKPIRDRILKLSASDFIEASRALGVSTSSILFYHLLWKGCRQLIGSLGLQMMRDTLVFNLGIAVFRGLQNQQPDIGSLMFRIFEDTGLSGLGPQWLIVLTLYYITFQSINELWLLFSNWGPGFASTTAVERYQPTSPELEELGGKGSESRQAIVSIRGLGVSLWHEESMRPILTNVDLEVYSGETLGLVGESGSGKSVLARSMVGMPGFLPGLHQGRVTWQTEDKHIPVFDDQRDVSELARQQATYSRWQRIAKSTIKRSAPVRTIGVSYLFQDARGGLDPFSRIKDQIENRFRQVKAAVGDRLAWSSSRALLEEFGLKDVGMSYPHNLSGGEAERAAIAMTLVKPYQLLIADEPTTGLDAAYKREVVDVLLAAKSRARASLLLISHDLSVVSYACDRIAVMYSGMIVEQATGPDFELRHPYSKDLMAGSIEIDLAKDHEGSIVADEAVDSGCPYRNNCSLFRENHLEGSVASQCEGEMPPPRYFADGESYVACWGIDTNDR